MSQFSRTGDGQICAPTNRSSSTAGAAKPAKPEDQHETQVIAALGDRYEQLDALWQSAEEDLKRFRLHTPVRTLPFNPVPVFPDNENGPCEYEVLGFLRIGKGWRICFGVGAEGCNNPRDEEVQWTPISDCAIDRRIEAIPKFEELRKLVVETAEQSVPKLDTALTTFRRILDS